MQPVILVRRSSLTPRGPRDVVVLVLAVLTALILGFATTINDGFVEWIENTPFVHADLLVLVVLAIGLIVFSSRRWHDERRSAVDLRRALAEIDTLTGLIPIRSSCKRIRDKGEYWVAVEAYVASHSRAEFSHAICPECAARDWAEFEAGLMAPASEQ